MDAFKKTISDVVENGFAFELSHFFISLILLLFTIFIVYRVLLIVESRKYNRNGLGESKNLNTSYSWMPERLQVQINHAENVLKISFSSIATKYFIIGIVALIGSIILVMVDPLFGVILGVVALLLFYAPFQTFKVMQRNRINLINLELPEYLESFALLKQQQPLFQTTLDSIKFAGPTIKPYVEQLILDIQLHAGSTEPYKRFAEDLGQVDVATFMNTMIETTNVNEKLESELLQEELTQISRMRSDVYESFIEEIGSKIDVRNMILSIPILIIILIFMFYTIALIIGESGIM